MTKAKKIKIDVQGLCKSFGSNHVLTGVDLQVLDGESLVIIGGSGSGKSISIKSILGLIEPDEGIIKIDGVDVLKDDPKEKGRSQIGMLFQGGALFDSITVWENIAFKLIHHKKMPVKKARQIAIDKLAAVGLSEKTADLLPAELSGGMQKRVSLARAIADNPQILFFDEPTTGLDPITSATINDLIRSVTRDAGIAAISITHDMASVRAIADKVAMIYEGKIIWCGDVRDIDNSGNEYVDQFIHGRAEGPIQTIKAS